MYTPSLPCTLTVTPFGPKYRNPRTEDHVLFWTVTFLYTHTQCGAIRAIADELLPAVITSLIACNIHPDWWVQILRTVRCRLDTPWTLLTYVSLNIQTIQLDI